MPGMKFHPDMMLGDPIAYASVAPGEMWYHEPTAAERKKAEEEYKKHPFNPAAPLGMSYGIGGLIKKHGGKLLKKGIAAGKAKAKEAIVDKIKDKVAEEVGKIVKKQIGLRKGGKVTKRRSKKAAKKRAAKRRR